MNKAYLLGIAFLLVLGSLSVFTVDEREKAMKLQFGDVRQVNYEPGLHFKWFFQNILKFDARIQTLDADPQLYLTSEKKNVIVDSFVKWRVDNTQTYFTSTGGNALRANDRLSATIQKRLKDEFGKRTVRQVVSGERGALMDKLTVLAKEQADELGIEIIDVRIKRVDLPESVSQSVFDRMSAERTKVAKKFRSEGEEQARTLRAQSNREREVIIAEAEREGQQIRGDGDGTATEIFGLAYNQDREFYTFYRSLNAYQTTFSSRADILLIEPDSTFFRYFKDPHGGAQ